MYRKPYSYFRSKYVIFPTLYQTWTAVLKGPASQYVIFPTLYQNWTAVLESPACVLGTLSLFRIKIRDFPYPISELNCCPWESSMCAGTLSLFQIKICDFPYPISELNCCPWESSMCPGNLIPISDQNMWFSLPYIRTELLSSKVQHVFWKPYPYFRSKYVIFSTLYQNWTAVLEGPACVLKTLSQFQIKICDFLYPISELNCCPRGSSMCPGSLIPISDQNMWFSLPYITTELLSSRV